MKPLKNWDNLANGFTFKQIYPLGWGSLSGKPHLGLDKIAPSGTPIYMPFTGKVVATFGSESGYMATIYPAGKSIVIRLMHGKQAFKSGNFNEGDLIGYVGSTGASTSPHVHVDISQGSVNINNINNFINPATFDWGEGANMPDINAMNNLLNAHQNRLNELFTEDKKKGKIAVLISDVSNLKKNQTVSGMTKDEVKALILEVLKEAFK